MKREILALAAALLTSVATHAQEVTSSERWSGKVTVGLNTLRIGFAIQTHSDGKQVCTMDVPDQGAKDIPVVLQKNDSDSLHLSVAVLRATYKGRKVSSGAIEGVFYQNGYALPLHLQPGGFDFKRPQTPQAPLPYTTREVVFKNEAEGAELSGTLTYPLHFENEKKGTVPVVLLVTGSGAQNRNEEVFGHQPFLVIADFFAKQGIATLRYDDRGVGRSTGPTEGMTTENSLADAEAGVAYLRSLQQFGKVGVLGHSEGGTIAFMMGAKKQIDFLISCAGVAALGIDVIVGQNEALMKQQGASQQLIHDYTAALRMVCRDRVEGKKIAHPSRYIEDLCQAHGLMLPAPLKVNLAKCVTQGGAWLTWFLGYNPASAIRKVTCPVMALNGEWDMQVLCDDNLPIIERHLPANKGNIIKKYASLNHLFQHCTPATALRYSAIEETFSEEVLQDMVHWIRQVK